MRGAILVSCCAVLSMICAGCGGGSSSLQPQPPPSPPPQPVGTLAPPSLSFGSTIVSTTSAAQALTLANNSTPVLTVNSITATAPFSQTNNCPASPSSNASCTINVTFAPTTAGNSTGSITIVDNASNSPQTASLSGTGIEPPVTLSPASLNFGDIVVGNSSGVHQVVCALRERDFRDWGGGVITPGNLYGLHAQSQSASISSIVCSVCSLRSVCGSLCSRCSNSERGRGLVSGLPE